MVKQRVRNYSKDIISIVISIFILCMMSMASISYVHADNQTITIALDAGHGGNDSGAVNTYQNKTYKESEMTLKIANNVKRILEETGRFNVIMTRSDNTYKSISTRVETAKNANVDALVSLHINSGGGGENGAEVYYQNSSWKPGIATTSQILANNIQNNLVSAGIGNRGIKIRNSTPDAADRYYPDGSLSDYYAVNHRGKTAGLPAIIVEHCFISSAYDRNNFLSNENSLMRMGVADARGIAETFGLSR